MFPYESPAIASFGIVVAVVAGGILLLWASLNQGGSSHINNHDPQYLRNIFEPLGYVYDELWSARMQHGYFQSKAVAYRPGGMNTSMPNTVEEAAAFCGGVQGTFGPPSPKFYPKCLMLVLRRAAPLRRHCVRHHRHAGGSRAAIGG